MVNEHNKNKEACDGCTKSCQIRKGEAKTERRRRGGGVKLAARGCENIAFALIGKKRQPRKMQMLLFHFKRLADGRFCGRC